MCQKMNFLTGRRYIAIKNLKSSGTKSHLSGAISGAKNIFGLRKPSKIKGLKVRCLWSPKPNVEGSSPSVPAKIYKTKKWLKPSKINGFGHFFCSRAGKKHLDKLSDNSRLVPFNTTWCGAKVVHKWCKNRFLVVQ